ncbi:cell division protein FtsL [bacterium]|nr:cell division protein FtsL [bacterium]
MYKSIGSYLQIFLMSLIIFLFYVWQSVQRVETDYKINCLEKDIQFFKNNNRYLKIRLNELTSLGRVERIARKKLGLVSPGKNDVIVIFE